MPRACFAGGRLLLTLAIGTGLPLLGCGDDSKTSGTMVEHSEEEKEFQKKKLEAYRAKADAKAQAKKTRGVGGRR